MKTRRKSLILVLFFVLLLFLFIISGKFLIAPAPRETSTPTKEPVVISITYTPLVERKTGIVKWYDNELGYGYIMPDDGGAD